MTIQYAYVILALFILFQVARPRHEEYYKCPVCNSGQPNEHSPECPWKN
jgi:hypothetical protein